MERDSSFPSLQNLIPPPLPFSVLGLWYVASPPLSLRCFSFAISYAFYLGFLLYCLSLSPPRIATSLPPPNVLYSTFLGMRLLSMLLVCPTYISTCHQPIYMAYHILFSICRFLLLVAVFVSISFNQISRLCQS